MKTPVTALPRFFLLKTSVFLAAILSMFSPVLGDEVEEDAFQDVKGVAIPLGIPNPSLAHYQDDIPPVTPGAYSPSFDTPSLSKNTWFSVSASGLYIFNTNDDIKGHTGWGGVIDASVLLVDRTTGFYFKTGLDFVYFQTEADKGRDGVLYNEEIQSYKVHLNGGLGYRTHGFDFYGWLGFGMGATHTDGTPYNLDRSHTSADFLFQLGARISYSPTEYCSIYAGYRMMWNIPLEGGGDCYYYDDDDDWWYGGGYRCHDRCVPGCTHDSRCNCPDDSRDYPSVLAHAFEVGITFYS
jgi:hypothetical protein